MIQLFGDCELDEARFELRRRGAVVKIEPKTFDLLAYLIRCADRVVSKDELLDAVWPDQVVSESVLPKCVAAARRAVGDARTPARVIQTVHGRGYRFIAAVERRDPVPSPRLARRPPSAPFVGHVQAMARLRQALESSLAGRGRVALLVGEPGIGKTRTSAELATEARNRGALVLVGRAYEGEGAPAFWPWVQILRAARGRRARRRPVAVAARRAGSSAGCCARSMRAPRRRAAQSKPTRRAFGSSTALRRRSGARRSGKRC